MKEGRLLTVVVENDKGYSIELFNIGAILNRYQLREMNVLDGYVSALHAAQYLINGFHGAKLCPFVCRLNEGMYLWNNQQYKTGKHYLQQHAIHGLVYDALFDFVGMEETAHQITLKWYYQYRQSDAGYPFPFELKVNYTLDVDGKVIIETTVTNNAKEVIPFADGWHPYFQFNTSIDDCFLQMNAYQKIEMNEQLIPTGKLIADNSFLQPKSLRNQQLDDGYVLDEKNSCILLTNSTYTLQILPKLNYPYVQLFTPNHRRSIAIECLSAAPDAFNNKIGLIALEPHQSKTFSTQYWLQQNIKEQQLH